jgi:hypothetical protein
MMDSARVGSSLACKNCTRVEVSGYIGKHSSSVWYVMNGTRKMFYEIGLWAQCQKTFYVRNLQIFVKSPSVCPWQPFQS